MQTEQQTQMKNPGWWTEDHTKGWDRVKEAFRRDWEQTKSDLSKTKGQNLDQQVGDTVKQAIGSEQIPPAGQPNHGKFAEVESAYRYGYGARQKYSTDAKSWTDELDGRLSKEWSSLGATQKWSDVRPHVRKAWETQPEVPAGSTSPRHSHST
jgi:hypothetical protein